MCGSTIHFKDGAGNDTMAPLTPASHPQWLGSTPAAGKVCYDDVHAPLKPGAVIPAAALVQPPHPPVPIQTPPLPPPAMAVSKGPASKPGAVASSGRRPLPSSPRPAAKGVTSSSPSRQVDHDKHHQGSKQQGGPYKPIQKVPAPKPATKGSASKPGSRIPLSKPSGSKTLITPIPGTSTPAGSKTSMPNRPCGGKGSGSKTANGGKLAAGQS